MPNLHVTHYVGDGCDEAHGSPPCLAPDPQWRTCGIPRAVHDEAFSALKGSRFYHEWQGAEPVPETPEEAAE